jgi:hypothetical protein
MLSPGELVRVAVDKNVGRPLPVHLVHHAYGLKPLSGDISNCTLRRRDGLPVVE